MPVARRRLFPAIPLFGERRDGATSELKHRAGSRVDDNFVHCCEDPLKTADTTAPRWLEAAKACAFSAHGPGHGGAERVFELIIRQDKFVLTGRQTSL
jgi:hypothetical protein